jgi:hypothetical protein
MSGAEQFTAAVPERGGPTDWRGGLSGAAQGGVGGCSRLALEGELAMVRVTNRIRQPRLVLRN